MDQCMSVKLGIKIISAPQNTTTYISVGSSQQSLDKPEKSSKRKLPKGTGFLFVYSVQYPLKLNDLFVLELPRLNLQPIVTSNNTYADDVSSDVIYTKLIQSLGPRTDGIPDKFNEGKAEAEKAEVEEHNPCCSARNVSIKF